MYVYLTNVLVGHVFPSQATMYIAGVEMQDMMDHTIGFWSDVYGFDMRTLLTAGMYIHTYIYISLSLCLSVSGCVSICMRFLFLSCYIYHYDLYLV